MRVLRVLLTLVVVAALGAIGWQSYGRLATGPGEDDLRSDPQTTANAWAAAVSAGDTDRVLELVSDRVDTEQVAAAAAMLAEGFPDGVEVVARGVAIVDNVATSELRWTAALPGGGTWSWDARLELIRARGRWSVNWAADAVHPSLRAGWSLRTEVLEPARAPVLDRLGRSLSRTGAAVEVGVQPGRLPDRERMLSTVASVLPEAYDPLVDLLDRDDLNDDWYYPLVTVTGARADEAWPDLLSLSGFLRRDAEPGVGAAIAAPEVVGIVALEDGVRRGVTGLEEVYDDRLTGSTAVEVTLHDPEGREREVLHTFQEDPAPPLVTTLDRDVQRAVDDALLAVTRNSAVVVVDPAEAGILAVASRPSTGYLRAFEGRYPPAAIAGIVPLTAALRDGADLDDPLACPQEATVGGVQITSRQARADDQATLRDAMTGGCDVALARLGVTHAGEGITQALEFLGLREDPELPLPASAWSWPATSGANAHASAGIGHARVQASALGAAQLAAAIARGAPAELALIADDVTSPSPWPGDVTTELRAILRRSGEVGPVQQADVRVAGAVGASGSVRGDPAPATGWWFGFLEGAGPDVALAVVVEDDDGSEAAAIADRIVRELLGS